MNRFIVVISLALGCKCRKIVYRREVFPYFCIMIPAGLLVSIEQQLELFTGYKSNISSTQSQGGGSINHAVRLEYAGTDFFLRWNSSYKFPGMFEAEILGLNLLRKTGSIQIPKVIGQGDDTRHCYLLMEYIPQGHPDTRFWKRFGYQLASLHQNTAAFFGLDHDNYIGSLPQQNNESSNWHEFFIRFRIQPQLSMAVDKAYLHKNDIQSFHKLFTKLPHLIPAEAPCLLHGDLWSGNFLCSYKALPVLIDPAVYYGHREMDIAMTRLFGGFHPDFYYAYHEAFPLENDWEKRIDLCNLYPLLVHVNLFGGGYV